MNDTNPKKEESLAERSARLEAEAAAMAERDAIMDEDPLAPTEINDETAPEDAAEAYETAEEDNIKGHAVLEKLQAELDQAKDQAIRAVAEAENTRRRAQKEREDTAKFAVSGFAKDLLEVSDNLRRALEAMPENADETGPHVKSLIEGIEATERSLLRTFEKNGIKKLEPLDEPFDPNFHEVMFEAPVPGKQAGIVMQVMEPGYILNERLLRPARVGVTKDDGSAGPTEEPPAGGHIDTQA